MMIIKMIIVMMTMMIIDKDVKHAFQIIHCHPNYDL